MVSYKFPFCAEDDEEYTWPPLLPPPPPPPPPPVLFSAVLPTELLNLKEVAELFKLILAELENAWFVGCGDMDIMGGGVGVAANILSTLHKSRSQSSDAFSEVLAESAFLLDNVGVDTTLTLHSLHLSAIELPKRSSKWFSSVDDTDDDSTLPPLVSLMFVALLLLELILFGLLLLLLLWLGAVLPVLEAADVLMLLVVIICLAADDEDEDEDEADDEEEDKSSCFLAAPFPLLFSLSVPSVSSAEFLRLDVFCMENVKHSWQIRCMLHSRVVKLLSHLREQYEQK